jgi:hypothetical protein
MVMILCLKNVDKQRGKDFVKSWEESGDLVHASNVESAEVSPYRVLQNAQSVYHFV